MKKSPPDDRSFAESVVRRLRGAGHEALFAGGCVRDLLLGLVPKDYDVATSAPPEAVLELFPRSVPIGASFGVVQVRARRGRWVEVATFRRDGSYSDGRRPDHVTFSTAKEDALRRDFTINGMFLDPIEDVVHDYVGGKEDLARRTVRAIGNPTERIDEDKLRMLRAVRFTARLGFTLDPATQSAIRQSADDIRIISPERVHGELRDLIQPISRVRAMEMLWDLGLMSAIIPELTPYWQQGAPAARTLAILGHWPERIPFARGMAALVSSLPDSEAEGACREIMTRLRSSNDDIDRAAWLVRHRKSLDDVAGIVTHRIKRILQHPGRPDLLAIMEATEDVDTGGTANLDRLREWIDRWGEEGIDPPMLITGDDLVRLGYQPGRLFKEILDTVRDRQLDGELTEEKEAMAFVLSRWPVA